MYFQVWGHYVISLRLSPAIFSPQHNWRCRPVQVSCLELQHSEQLCVNDPEVHLELLVFVLISSSQNPSWPNRKLRRHFPVCSPNIKAVIKLLMFFFCFFVFFKSPSLLNWGRWAPACTYRPVKPPVLYSHIGSLDLQLLLNGIFHSRVQRKTRWQWQVLCHSLFSTKQKMTGNANCFSDDKFPSNALL